MYNVTLENNDSVLVYGLSTEGYILSNSLVSNSIRTTILDEKLHVATEITPQILSEYSTARSIIEAEALFSIQPEKNAISENPIIFFTPKIRETDDYKKKIKLLKPGITGIGSIVFRNEEKYLKSEENDSNDFYKKMERRWFCMGNNQLF